MGTTVPRYAVCERLASETYLRQALDLLAERENLSERTAATMAPRTEGRVRFQLRTPASPERRRQMLGLAVTVEGARLGEFAEAIVDFLAA